MLATRHLMIDAYDCNFDQSNSIMTINNMLVMIAKELDMKPVMPPFVLPYYYCDETDDGGISAFIVCENGSHITVHTFPYRYCYFVDILTDKFFSEKEAVELVKRQIYASNMNINVIDRRFFNESNGNIDEKIDFGPHYMITVENIVVSFEEIYSWLDHIAPQINMAPISRPYVIYDKNNDPEIISGVLVVAQSHIAFHYLVNEKTANIDIFSCSFIDNSIVEELLFKTLGGNVHYNLFARGSKHKYNINYSGNSDIWKKASKNWQNNIINL